MFNNSQLSQNIASSITAATGIDFKIVQLTAASGGCINDSFVASDGHRSYFIKINSADTLDMFEAEYAGLFEMSESNTIRVPVPVCTGSGAGYSWIVMESLLLGKQGSHSELGRQLAAMHRVTSPSYGWDRDNTIGSTPQINKPTTNWVEFLRDQRLAFQLDTAARKGYGGRLQKLGDQLLACIGDFFSGYEAVPSMLHGDLWSGNYAFIDTGEPVIFDPAFYYGDREADIAMTELFGGFSQNFYDAYNESWPLDDGYRARKTLYNCYHIINHLNLFGGGYGSQAENMMQRLLAECKA